jgi:FKBP-type peptidyl-prolyl cis-trans isomerase FklB
MRLITAILSMLLLAAANPSHAQNKRNISKVKLETGIDSVSYSFGLMVAKNLTLQGIEEINYDAFEMGFHHMMSDKKVKISPEDAHLIIQSYINSLREKEARTNLLEGEAFLAENKEKEGVVELPSGLQYKVIVSGNGKSPKANDVVKVHYKGTLIDGTVFDSSIERGKPAVFNVGGVIKGWTEALKLMRTGSKWMLYIPPQLAYGEKGAGEDIGPNATLIFEVELLEIMEK